MGEKHNELGSLKDKNPFKIPEGYMEGLTDRIMSQLPEKTAQEEVRRLSLVTIVRPWLYIAALFAGVIFCYNVFIGTEKKDLPQTSNSYLTMTEVFDDVFTMQISMDDEYLEYLEERYTDYILEAEMIDFE